MGGGRRRTPVARGVGVVPVVTVPVVVRRMVRVVRPPGRRRTARVAPPVLRRGAVGAVRRLSVVRARVRVGAVRVVAELRRGVVVRGGVPVASARGRTAADAAGRLLLLRLGHLCLSIGDGATVVRSTVDVVDGRR